MFRIIAALTLVLVVYTARAEEKQPPAKSAIVQRPVKIWNRTGPLGETPKHVTDAYPLSDQENKGGWVKFEPMWDEFEGQELDLKKWTSA